MKLLIVMVLLVLCAQVAKAAEPALWIYCPTNLQVDENITKLESLWTRAAKAGYTQVMLADSKFGHLGDVPDHYFQNCDRVKQIASNLHLSTVPAVFPLGYSNDLLANDPNLAEGLPVNDTPFEVKDGIARVVADPQLKFDRVSFKDDSVSVDGSQATVQPGKGVSRFVYKLQVKPFRAYHISVSVQTKNMKGQPEVKVLAGERSLNWANLGVKPTQDWTEHHAVFNSLNNTEVRVYFGIWNDPVGELRWKDWKIEEVGLLNVLRRNGAPCVVTRDGDSKPLREGTDYDPIVDPKMGTVPWRGEYQVWHTPPLIHTKLPDGTKLRVSWYYPPVVYDGQVAACISDPKIKRLLAEQAKRMKQIWDVPLYMMEHDEFRVCNWDAACDQRHRSPGELLADNVRECTDLLRPARAAVWNDMFDPAHNAVRGPYYLVNGPWTNSWEGLDKRVIIVNWNYGKRDQSLKFFADRGHEQVIAGYYDSDLADWSNWLASARKSHGIIGYMYTTWRNDYSKLEKFAEMSRK